MGENFLYACMCTCMYTYMYTNVCLCATIYLAGLFRGRKLSYACMCTCMCTYMHVVWEAGIPITKFTSYSITEEHFLRC